MLQAQDLKFAQLLCSRICHDLIALVGAINIGLELLEDHQGEDNKDIVNLITQSAQTSAKRLSLMRFTFGFGGLIDLTSFAEIRKVIVNSLDPKQFEFDWQIPDDVFSDATDLTKWGKLTANLVSSAIEAAPFGGKITMKQAMDNGGFEGDFNILLQLQSAKITLHQDNKQALVERTEFNDLTPRNIQAYLTWRLAQECGRSITIEGPENEVLTVRTRTSGE